MNDQHDADTQQIPAQTAEYAPLAYSQVPEMDTRAVASLTVPPEPERTEKKSAVSLNTVLLALVGVVLIAGLTVFSLALIHNTNEAEHAQNAQTQTTTVASPEDSTEDTTGGTADEQSGTPACSGDYAAGTDVTSAEFAEAVNDAYTSQATCGATATLHVWSPKTRKSYRMDCRPDGARMTCTGGSNAVVYIY